MHQQVHLLFLLQDQVFTVNNKIPTADITARDAFSASFAAGRIIVEQLNQLDLDKLSFCRQEHRDRIDQQSYKHYQPTNEVVTNAQYYFWAGYFNTAPLWNDDQEQHFYYITEITQSDAQIIQQQVPQLRLTPQDKAIDPEIILVLKSKTYLHLNARNIFYFSFKTATRDKYHANDTFLDTASIYNGLYRRRNDKWTEFKVAQQKYPTQDQLMQASYIIMPGSSASVYDEYQWITKTAELLNYAYKNNKQLKLLCVCFGLQIMTLALKGVVEHTGGFIMGNTELEYNLQLCQQFKLCQSVQMKKIAIINEVHGDEITQLPQEFITIASSNSCKHEVIISKDERILGFQGHPEYSSDYFISLSGNQSRYKQKEDPLNIQLCQRFLK